jgi:hypothetical protein
LNYSKSGRYKFNGMSFFKGSVKMNRLRVCIGVWLLASLSGTCIASQGVVAFRGAIVETPCPVSTSTEGFALHGCPGMPTGNYFSARNVESLRSFRSIDNPVTQVKLIHQSADEGGSIRQQYALVDGNGQPVTSGNYVVTLALP